MNVLLINGSPHEKGCTYTALSLIAGELNAAGIETEILNVGTYAIHHGEPGDIVILAGKGHEDYQEIKGKKYAMDERVLIREILEEDKEKNR